MEFLTLTVSAIFISNILLAQYLGNCPFLGVSKKMDTAIGMSGAVIFVLTLSGIITWAVQYKVLVPFGLEYLQTIVFILVIAALVQFIEMFLKKSVPPLYRALGIFLPLITTNCAVLGVALLNIKKQYDFAHMLVFSVTSAVGFSLALVLFAGIREKFETARIPGSYQGTAIGLVTAGLMALAFLGFTGMV
jgi:electron transport complex protein RnfA